VNVALKCLIALASGAAYEAACVGWVHNSERGRAFVTALFSMVVALCEVVGVGESIHDLRAAPFFVLGYGLGTFGAVKWKSRNKEREGRDGVR